MLGVSAMKKVLFIMNNLGGGGAEKVLIDILNVFDYKKYDVDILLVNNEGIYKEKLNENVSLNYIYNPIKIKNRFIRNIIEIVRGKIIRYFSSLVYRIKVKKIYDIEIAFLEGFPATYILSNSTNIKSKKIAWIHTDLSKSRTLSFKNEEKMYSKINNVVCVSQESKEVFDKLYPVHSEKSEIIYNLINRDIIIEKSNENIDYLFKKTTIIGCGRLASEKRFDLLIKAHKLLVDDGVENELIIVGSGEKEEELESLIQELGVNDTVKLLGFKSNPYPYIKNSDVFVMSSDFEGFSLVVAEAMILGKAIVSTKCVGPSELLENGEIGILTNYGDEIEMKDAIKKIIQEKSIKENYENKALKKSEDFNYNEIMNKIYSLLNR